MSRPLIAFLMSLLATAGAFAQQPVGFPFQDNTFQTWTVPDTGWYLLDVSGGQGGDASNGSHAGGKGAQIQASVRLTKGEVLRIAVGGQGGKGTNNGNNPSGGGGGGSSSIVRVKNTATPLAPSSNDEPLLIVAGGGGAASQYAGNPGNATSEDGDFAWGGKNGNGAGDSTTNFYERGAGGAGYLTSGYGTDIAEKGLAYLLGNRGGHFISTAFPGEGGAGGWGGGGQGGGHLQEGLSSGGAPVGAKGHGVAQVGHPLKTQAPLGETIEGQEFGGFPQQLLAFGRGGGEGQGLAEPLAAGGDSEAGHLAAEAGPLQQFQGFGPNPCGHAGLVG
jgi:hypothetical protein